MQQRFELTFHGSDTITFHLNDFLMSLATETHCLSKDNKMKNIFNDNIGQQILMI